MKFKSKEEFINRVMKGEKFKASNGDILYYSEAYNNPFRHGDASMEGRWYSITTEDFEIVEPEPKIELRWRVAKNFNDLTEVTSWYYNQKYIDKYYKGWYKFGDPIEVEVPND